MRFTKALVLLIIIIFSFSYTAFAESGFTEGCIDISGTKLYLRATEDSPIVHEFDEGARIGVYAEEGEYARVVFGNYRGYVKRETIFVPTEDAYEASVYANGLNVRMSPGEYSTVITQLKEDTKIKIVDVYGTWYRINIAASDVDGDEDISGFVAKEFVLISNDSQGDIILRPKMSGSRVKTLQKELKARRFLSANATGYYGLATKQAVGDFQVAAKLSPDGIAGQETLTMLYADNGIKAPRVTVSSSSSGGSSSSGSSSGGAWGTCSATYAALSGLGKVHLSSWESIDVAWPGLSNRKSALITDVTTGKQFRVTRYNKTSHADVAPDSANDTAILKSVYGGSWSWDRRPIWVTVNGKTYAASMNGMPHGSDYNPNDNMNGHICIHFNGSLGHATPSVDSRHQEAVQFAYSIAKG